MVVQLFKKFLYIVTKFYMCSKVIYHYSFISMQIRAADVEDKVRLRQQKTASSCLEDYITD